MTSSLVYSDISNVCDLLVRNGIALDFPSVAREATRYGERVGWRQSHVTMAKPRFFGTPEQYLSILRDRSYTLLLYDGAVMRMTYEFDFAGLAEHNLWYYPCPVDLAPGDTDCYPVEDLVELLLAEDVNSQLRLRGPVRFDFDRDRGEECVHPAAHVHVVVDDARIPALAPMSPGRFVKFVFRQFYPAIWGKYRFLHGLPDGAESATMLPSERTLVHFSWT